VRTSLSRWKGRFLFVFWTYFNSRKGACKYTHRSSSVCSENRTIDCFLPIHREKSKLMPIYKVDRDENDIGG
jgi:hypothetical protein